MRRINHGAMRVLPRSMSENKAMPKLPRPASQSPEVCNSWER